MTRLLLAAAAPALGQTVAHGQHPQASKSAQNPAQNPSQSPAMTKPLQAAATEVAE